MKAELIQIKGDTHQPYNVFVDDVCIGTFQPNSAVSVGMLADALGLYHGKSCSCCSCDRVREITSL
jgi:hypothetical protein